MVGGKNRMFIWNPAQKMLLEGNGPGAIVGDICKKGEDGKRVISNLQVIWSGNTVDRVEKILMEVLAGRR